MGKFTVTTLAVTAVMVAVVAVLTMFPARVPIPATGGYIHFGDVGVYFSAFAFGPIIGSIAGGVGCAIADIVGGFANFALLTLVAHGLQGLLAGFLGWKRGVVGMIIGWAVGSLAMILVYFLGEWFILDLGLAGPLAEVIPNLIQNVVGGVIGIPLVLAVRKAYPPIDRIGVGRTWQEAETD